MCGYGVVLTEQNACKLHDVFRDLARSGEDAQLPPDIDMANVKCMCSFGPQWILECVQDQSANSSCNECTCSTACITILDFIKFLEVRSSSEDSCAICMDTLSTLTLNPSLVCLCVYACVCVYIYKFVNVYMFVFVSLSAVVCVDVFVRVCEILFIFLRFFR